MHLDYTYEVSCQLHNKCESCQSTNFKYNMCSNHRQTNKPTPDKLADRNTSIHVYTLFNLCLQDKVNKTKKFWRLLGRSIVKVKATDLCGDLELEETQLKAGQLQLPLKQAATHGLTTVINILHRSIICFLLELPNSIV